MTVGQAHPLPVLSNSRMKNARGCLRYDKYRYVLRYKPVRQTAALRFGTLLHAGLEVWWRGWTLPPEPRLTATLAALQGEADPFERAKAEALLIGYHERWHDDHTYDIAEVVAVEAQFEGPLVNPRTGAESRTWRRGGKIDALVRDSYRNAQVVEHKSSSEDIRQGSDYWLRLRMDSQVSTYYEGARFLGHDVVGCIYDVVKKPMLRPSDVPVLAAEEIVDDEGVPLTVYTKVVLDANGNRVRTKDGKKWRQTADTELGYVLQTRPETPDEFKKRILESIAEDPGAYYQRGDVPRLERDTEEALLDDWHFAQSLRIAVREDRAPRNPDNCKKYGRLCEFFGVCTGAASLDDPSLFVQVEDPNTELIAGGCGAQIHNDDSVVGMFGPAARCATADMHEQHTAVAP